ncbi:MAG: hypothetical protein IPF44_10575 [Betaproteobacteria bacterium]|nr:hypothetical protein [Betaproteobacteria bacterium]
MIFKVYLMRRGGRRLKPVEVMSGPAYVGDLRTVTGQCKELSYKVAELVSTSVTSARLLPPLYEPVLTGIAPQAMVLRGFERMKEPEGYYSVVQEWHCEIV